MRVRVKASLPRSTLFTPQQREALARAGITRGELRKAWCRALHSVLRSAYPHDTFTVFAADLEGDGDGDGVKLFHLTPDSLACGPSSERACFAMTSKLEHTARIAEASWVAALGTFSELIARHRTAVYS